MKLCFIEIVATIVGILVFDSNLFALEREVSVEWFCPQTSSDSNSLDPGIAKRIFTFKSSSKAKVDELDSPQFRAFLTQLDTEHSAIDYFPCIENLLYSDALNADSNIKISNSLRTEVLKYAQRAFERGARAPYLPMEISAFYYSDQDIQSHLCSSQWSRGMAAYFMSESFVQEKLPKINLTDSNCTEIVKGAYLDAVADLQLSDQQCKNNPKNCELVKNAGAKLMNRLYNTFRDTPFHDLPEMICNSQGETISRLLRELHQNAQSVDDCVQLSENDPSKVIDRANVGTTVSAHYTLTRKKSADGKPLYDIALNTRFYVRDPNRGKSVTDYKEKTEKCLSAAQKYLKGPSGEQMVIRIGDPKKDNLLPAPFEVELHQEHIRSHSKEWSNDVNCATIMHEIFHQLGLVDEYEEKEDGFITDSNGNIVQVKNNPDFSKYDCRSTGPKDSVMHDQNIAFAAVSGKYVVDSCACINEDDRRAINDCRRTLSSIRNFKSGDSCPKGSSPSSDTYPVFDFLEYPDKKQIVETAVERARKNESKPYLEAVRFEPPSRSSLLLPAQFRAITTPGCSAQNKIYYQCAQNAYETSRNHYGRGCVLGMPNECSGGSDKWIRK